MFVCAPATLPGGLRRAGTPSRGPMVRFVALIALIPEGGNLQRLDLEVQVSAREGGQPESRTTPPQVEACATGLPLPQTMNAECMRSPTGSPQTLCESCALQASRPHLRRALHRPCARPPMAGGAGRRNSYRINALCRDARWHACCKCKRICIFPPPKDAASYPFAREGIFSRLTRHVALRDSADAPRTHLTPADCGR